MASFLEMWMASAPSWMRGILGMGVVLSAWPAWAQFQPASTVQQPTFGVSIDAHGVLTTPLFAAAGDPMFRQRAALAKARLPADVFSPSPLRKISLRRLQEAIRGEWSRNGQIDEVLQKLAGLLSIQYVFILPDEGDIVLAGPAEGWMEDASGRSVGVTSGRPTVLLEDLVVGFRTFGPDQPQNTWVGCTINPQPEAVARLAEFKRSVPGAVPQAARSQVALQMASGMREALGLANIVVFTLPPRSHMAQVMIEADYRMKLIAVGLEAPPLPMPTFFSQLKLPPRSEFQRWWFRPDYRAVKLSRDRLSLGIVGESVELLTEDYAARPGGQLVHTGKQPSGPAKVYAKAFTRHYPKIARRSPVFQQLRNMIDVLVVSAFLQQEKAWEQSRMVDNVFYDPSIELVRELAEPLRTPCVANAAWKGSRLVAVAGGGVSIQASQALAPDNVVPDPDGTLTDMRQALELGGVDEPWWWD